MTTKANRRATGSLNRSEETPAGQQTDVGDSNNNNISGSTTTSGKNAKLPSIKGKRGGHRKPRVSSFLEVVTDNANTQQQDSNTITTTTTNNTNNNNTNTTKTSNNNNSPAPSRRSSVPQGGAPQPPTQRKASKPSFAGIGKKVSSLVKARLAFQGRKGRGEEGEDTNHMEVIHELPRSPRFSTFLSAEAQYAVMKGYEDKLYEKLADSNPEMRPVLNRTKTPFHKSISFHDTEDAGTANKSPSPDEGFVTPGSKSMTSASPSSVSTPAATRVTSFSPTSDVSSKSPDERVISPESGVTHSTVALPSPFLRPLRRQSVDVASGHSHNQHRGEEGAGWALHRTSSLPSLPPGPSSKQRLVMTYRLESAMDILDTIKRRNKENSLSPRVFRIPRRVEPVRDFNSWTKVWNKEFKEVKAKVK